MNGMDAQQLATIAQGLAVLRVKPSDAYTHQLVAAAGQLLPSFSPSGLGMLAYALTLLGVRPSAAWRRAFVVTAGRSLHRSSAQNLCCVAMVLAWWREEPGAAWWGQFFATDEGLLRRGSHCAQVCAWLNQGRLVGTMHCVLLCVNQSAAAQQALSPEPFSSHPFTNCRAWASQPAALPRLA